MLTMSIKIDKNVPIPKGTRVSPTVTYPFGEMEIGDSFFVPPFLQQTTKQLIAKMRHEYRNFAKQQDPQPKFTAKISEENSVVGVRVWKIT